MVKNLLISLKSIFISTFIIAPFSFSTFVTTSCFVANNENGDSKIDPEAMTIHIDGIGKHDNCRVDSSLFSVGSSYKFNELDTDIVLGVNEIKNYDVIEVIITISNESVEPIEIKIENGQQTSDKKYDGITFQFEEDPQEFGGKVFSKVLRLKKDTLKEVINDLNCQTNDVNISFDFHKIVKEPNAKTKVYISLQEDDDKELKDGFKGVKLNNQGESDVDWYTEGEYEVAIDELSSITIAYEDDAIGCASDDQQFFIRKEFENEFADGDEVKFIDELIEYKMTPKTEGNITIFELKYKITDLGDVYLTNIHSEYIQPKAADYYTFIDDSGNIIFLLDWSLEAFDDNIPITGFYLDDQGIKQNVEYLRETFDGIINVGKNITSIGDNFLYGCPNIEYVNFENGFDNIRQVGVSFMGNCKKLKNIQIKGENDKILTIGSDSDDMDTSTSIGSYFLYDCGSFNQEIKVVNETEIWSHFLAHCDNFNSNITFEIDGNDGLVSMSGFMSECKNMTSTIIINSPSNANDLSNIFQLCGDRTLSVSSKTDNSYVEGIKIGGRSTEHIYTFMSFLPNSDSGPFYRKLLSV